MIEAAAREGWNAIQTARHYGVHRNIIDDACERFDIELPRRGTDYTALASDTSRKKPKAVWSASPDAIKRALDKLQRAKQLQSAPNTSK
jgi:hypothetical protein